MVPQSELKSSPVSESTTTFNRWLIPVAAVAIHICIGSVYAWSTFNRPIKALFPRTIPRGSGLALHHVQLRHWCCWG